MSISKVLHQANVEVDEGGTVAAAATAIGMEATSAPNPKPIPEFRADRPFLFLIRENAKGTLLFMGRVVDPSV